MKEKCKYCDYVSECPRKCEYDSIMCKVYRSFPRVVDKSYEQLQQENKQLKYNWNKLKEIIKKKFVAQGGFTSYEWNDLLNELLDKMQELEQGSDKE